jgi:hypothetical protein
MGFAVDQNNEDFFGVQVEVDARNNVVRVHDRFLPEQRVCQLIA